MMYVLPSTSLTPPREDQLAPLYPSNWTVVVLNLIDPGPAGAIDFSLSVPAGIFKCVVELTITCFPAFGSIIRSWTDVEILLSSNFNSWPIINAQFLSGPILSSSTSSIVRGDTAVADHVSCDDPLFATPLVWVGKFPAEAVVPGEVTS